MATLVRRKTTEAVTGYLFLAPWLFIFLTFILFSLGYALYLSLTRYDLLTAPEWWGI
jgi:multiple sugar transport system permease protein